MATVTDPIMLDATGQDIKDQISALNTKIQTLNTLLANLGLVSITPISQQDYDALSQAEKLAGVFDIYDAVEPNIDGSKITYDSGSNANGNYIKFADGTMICYKSVAVRNLAVSTAWGSIYESDLVNLGDLPQEFYTAPIVTASVVNGNAWLEAIPISNNKTLGTTRFVRPTTATLNADVRIIAIGRWKA